MSQQHEDYAGLLKALREAPDEPTESISIDRAIQDGRRTIRRRRVLGGIAVVGIVGAASSARPLLNAFHEPPVAGPLPGVYQPFQIWGREFDVGTAGGFTPYEYVTGRRFQIIALARTDHPAVDGPAAVATLYASGLRSVPTAALQLESIEGRPAYLTSETSGGTTITWEYADFSWGTVTVHTDHSDRAQRARHIAESIHRRKTPARVTVPFIVPRRVLEKDAEIVMFRVPYGSAHGRLTYEIAVAVADPADPAEVSTLPTVGIHQPTPEEKPNATFGGRPVLFDGGRNATFFGVGSGYAADAMAYPPLDARAIANAVTLIHDVTKPETWTDEPLR